MAEQPVGVMVASLTVTKATLTGLAMVDEAQVQQDAIDTINAIDADVTTLEERRAAAVAELTIQIDTLAEHVRTFGPGNGAAPAAIKRAQELLPLVGALA